MNDPTEDMLAVENIKRFLSQINWTKFVKIVCGVVTLLFIAAAVIKTVRPAWLAPEAKLELLLVGAVVSLVLPYISSFKAFGVEVGIKEQVEKVSAWTEASPYYTLASEYESAEDYYLAEKYYLLSLDKCDSFWPSILGLGSIYQDQAETSKMPDDYCKAINMYQKVLELDKENTYAFNNLASVYIKGPPPIRDPQQALDFAEKALNIWKAFPDSLYFKGVALNYLKRYQESADIFKTILDNEWLADDKDSVKYELAVANSNLGIRITEPTLDDILKWADKPRQAKLLGFLKDETQRFSVDDRSAITGFLDRKKKGNATE